MLNAAIVPKACDAVPMEILLPIGDFTAKKSKILKPKTAPNIPVTITQTTVSEDIPPMVFEISRAMGVVTDLAAIDLISWLSAPNHFAI